MLNKVCLFALMLFCVTVSYSQNPNDPYVNGLPVFGAELGNGWVTNKNVGENGDWGRLSDRLSNLNNDRFVIVQYTPARAEELANHPPAVWHSAEDIVDSMPAGMKMVFTFPFYAENYSTNIGTAKVQMADFIEGILNKIHADGNLGRIFAIEVGAEEESNKRWTDNDPTNPQFTWHGSYNEGVQFSEVYLAVKNRLSLNTNLQNVKIISTGSIEKHSMLNKSYVMDTVTIGSETRRKGSSKEFVRGFVKNIYDNYGLSKLPDMVGLHGFAGEFNPEFWNDTSLPEPDTFWIDRLYELSDICFTETNDQWNPGFCLTGYAFAGGVDAQPPDVNVYAPVNYVQELPGGGFTTSSTFDREYTQAIYYLRTQLMAANGATSDFTPFGPLGWKSALYFHHTFDAVTEVGFFNKVGTSQSQDSRPSSIVSQKLFWSGTLGLNETANLVYRTTILEYFPNDFVAVCGWERIDGAKIFALWRFTTGQDFHDLIPASRLVSIPGQYNTTEFTPAKYDFNLNPVDFSFSNPNISFSHWTFPSFGRHSVFTHFSIDLDENPQFILINN